jgi:hypothetical protein
MVRPPDAALDHPRPVKAWEHPAEMIERELEIILIRQ